MDTTIDLSSDDSVVVEAVVKPAKVVPKKIKKVGGKKLDDTVELISSDDDDFDDQAGADDETAFVTATEATLRNDTNKTAFMSPSSTSFMPPMSSTLTSAKLDNNGEESFNDGEDDANTTANETALISEAGAALFHEVHDEFLNTSARSEASEPTTQYNNTETSNTLVDASASNNNSSAVEESTDVSKTNKTAIAGSDASTNGVASTNVVSKVDDISPESVVGTDTSTLVDEKPSQQQNVADEASPQNETSPSSLTVTTEDEDDDDDIEEERASHLTSLPSKRRRIMEPDLPTTCTVLHSNKTGGKVYLVGTAHFSKESQDDVARVIRAVQPDAVVLELCKARINILHTDEAKVQEEAANLTFDKMLATIRQNGVVQGTMYLFLLHFSAKLTKELGMAPGGEFRRAFLEARTVPGCIIQLGDRPIEVTLKRAFTTLSLWQKLKFGYTILTYKDSITAEEVEQCKQKDLLASMLEEIAGEFPALSRVFVQERDLFLAHSLRIAVDSPVRFGPDQSAGMSPAAPSDPPVVVGVVGIGHVSGIVANWDKVVTGEIGKLMTIPKTSLPERIAYTAIRVSVIGLSLYTCYKVVQLPVSFVKARFF